MEPQERYDLFMEALDVTNQALDANRDEGAYGKMLDVFDDRLDGHRSAVAIYDDDPSEPFDYFTVRYLDGQFELVERGRGEHDSEWKVSVDYLESLRNDPETYIENPIRLDLDWLIDRLPDSVNAILERVA
jgi:hypothetical protein